MTDPADASPEAGPTPDEPPSEQEPARQAEAKDRAPAKERSTLRNTLEWVVVIVGAVAVALLVKTFAVQAFQIPSASMTPTLEVGDRVLVDKLTYSGAKAARGDVVVFPRPDSMPAAPDEPDDLIKRVIGLPGDELVIRDGSVFIDGRRLEEPYLPDTTITTPAGNAPFTLEEPYVVPDGQLFVMGDNRSNSTDSRFIGPIEADEVVGRAFTIMWPPGRIGTL